MTDELNFTQEYSNDAFTFSLPIDPGKLGQVERAMKAASLGTPVVAVVLPGEDRIVMAAPQVLPSPLMVDSGTSRFARVTPEIVAAHSGLSADGRVLLAAAIRIAVEHEYTFDEAIPVEILLEELALLYQEYTMKPGARPFGATLLIGYMPSKSKRQCSSGTETAFSEPMLFRIDPSGTVEGMKDYAIVNGNLERTQLPSTLKELASPADQKSTPIESSSSVEKALARALKASIKEKASKRTGGLSLSTDDDGEGDCDDPIEAILWASLSSTGHYRADRFEGLK